jgi:hypothetical protein
VLAAVCAALAGCAIGATSSPTPSAGPAHVRPTYRLSPDDDRFLEDLSKRSFLFFWEQADAGTGIIRDRAGTDGAPSANESAREIGSIASVGFGLSGMCIAAERGWLPRQEAIERTRRTLRFFAERIAHEHGWFYHFINLRSGAREWGSELSSIDTALLVSGALTVRQCFSADRDVTRLADAIYRRVDFQWMLAGDPLLLSQGWTPEGGFLKGRWDHYCELMILYVLAIGSPTHPIPAGSWYAWSRPAIAFEGYRYVGGADPLFVHQYSHAWVDFRGWREKQPPPADWFENSVTATRAHKAFCLSLSREFPGYSEHVWGITASDSRKGYVAWGGPPRHQAIDGSVVPAAAAGSLMFAPEITVPALREMHRRFGGRVYGRYGFADAFHPTDGWVNPDVIGINLGITLLSAENLRTGGVWSWFMRNPEIRRGLHRAQEALPPAALHVAGGPERSALRPALPHLPAHPRWTMSASDCRAIAKSGLCVRTRRSAARAPSASPAPHSPVARLTPSSLS